MPGDLQQILSDAWDQSNHALRFLAPSGTYAPTDDRRVMPLALNNRTVGRPEYPTVTKYANNPVFLQSQTWTDASCGFTWHSVIRVDDKIASPRAKYYMYYSTDHATSGLDGIGLAWSNSPYGPWTDLGVKVFRDHANGDQCETPVIIWNASTSLFHLYYQLAGATGANGTQSSMVATSPDGETWTIVGIALDVPSGSQFPGDGHTGYIRPFQWAGMWFAHSLCGGTTTPHLGLSYSRDGLTFQLDPRPLNGAFDQIPSPTINKLKWNTGNIIDWRGRPWFVGCYGPSATGGLSIDENWCAAPLALDFRRLAADPVSIAVAHQIPWEVDANAQGGSAPVVTSPTGCLVDGGKVYLYYRGGGKTGGVGVAELVLP